LKSMGGMTGGGSLRKQRQLMGMLKNKR